MRFFINLAYDGTCYHGWQIQPNGISVQECLQQALDKVLRCDGIAVVGAGRTDTGVHARLMTAHFDYPCSLDGKQLTYRLNKLLPPDICIKSIRRVCDDAHARFSATSRTYHYFVHTCKDPFLAGRSCRLFVTTDFALMNEAARLLLHYDDFTSFCKTGAQTVTNICHITEAEWTPVDDSLNCWRFTITANRFLRNMVRAIVGTLLMVGQGKLTIDDFGRVIESHNRCSAGDSVPAHALYLVNVEYPETIYLSDTICEE